MTKITKLADLNMYIFDYYLGGSSASGWNGDYYECSRLEGLKIFSERGCLVAVLVSEGLLPDVEAAKGISDKDLEMVLLDNDIYVAFMDGEF